MKYRWNGTPYAITALSMTEENMIELELESRSEYTPGQIVWAKESDPNLKERK